MSNSSLSKYSARIKDVYVELKGYCFFHSPYYQGDKRFIGRKKVKNRIITILKNTKVKSGAYLITGFRGMGKTSVVREAIKTYNEQCDKNTVEELSSFSQWINLIISKTPKWRRAIKRALGYFIGICSIYLLLLGKPELSTLQSVTLIFGLPIMLFIFFLLLPKRISNAIWNFFKISFLTCVFTLFGFYFYNPIAFCKYFHCLPEVPNWLALFSTHSAENGSQLLRVLFSIFLAYSLLSLVLFITDLSAQVYISMLNRLKRNKRKISSLEYHPFEINLSQESLDQIDILKRMTLKIEEYWLSNRDYLSKLWFDRKIYFLWRFILSYISLSKHPNTLNYDEILNKLAHLKKRMSGQVTSRKELNLNPNITTGISRGLTRIAMPIAAYSNKDEIAYPIASAKEIEDELINIIESIDKIRRKQKWFLPQFLFIIDELDKIEPHGNSTIQEKESTNPALDANIDTPGGSRFRQRQESVAKLLSNLKGFLNIARAKFFFIGGREMFDADLADIADRDSFYSSIFNDVIYVESFFKDFLGTTHKEGGVTQMTETYLCNIILNNLTLEEEQDKRTWFERFFYTSNPQKQETENEALETEDEQINKLNLKRLYEKLSVNLLEKDNTSRRKNKEVSLLFFEPDYITMRQHKPKEIANWRAQKKIERDQLLDKWLAEGKEVHQEEWKKLRLNDDEIKQQAYKVIFTLQNYIVYLNYRSNGTPKKLTGLTEQLIVKGPDLAYSELSQKKTNYHFLKDNVVVLHDQENNPLTTDFSQKLFLKFSFNTQYEIGLTANLYSPYLIANSRHLKSLGDKLLFSSSFIIDHILKFHPFGFSWRNLELIPEVVLVNREPNLRKYIEDLMRFYSLTYVRTTISGIFEYKFRSIVKRELIYLSKTSDLSSAAFNFTLDESLSTKRHFKKKLLEFQKKYANYTPTLGDNQFVHSLCFLQTILGNLHFYDKEYDDAILYYSESIQSLRMPNAIENKYITRHQFLLWLRNTLMLGLTLEKIRAVDSAFSLYRTLMLDTERYLEKIVNKQGSDLVDAEDHRTIHLICMPFVAFLAVLEKTRYDGITQTNLYRNQKEFTKTIVPLLEKESREIDSYRRHFLQADYYNNVGSILFYKNNQFPYLFNFPPEETKQGLSDAKEKKNQWWLDAFEEMGKENLISSQQRTVYLQSSTEAEYDFNPSLSSFNYYWNALYFLLKQHKLRILNFIEEKPSQDTIPLQQNLLALASGLLLGQCVDLVNSNRFSYLANVIAKIGDSLLSSISLDQFNLPDDFNPLDIINTQKKTKDGESHDSQLHIMIDKFRALVGTNLYHVESVFYCYKLSAVLFMRAGENISYAFQLKKILYLTKDLIALNINSNDEDISEEDKLKFKQDLKENLFKFWGIENEDINFDRIESIAVAVFKATTWNNEISNRPQILKYREILKIDNIYSKDRELIYNNINNINDNREVILLVEGIKMKLHEFYQEKYLMDFDKSKNIISAYNTMDNRYLRILELKYRSERCYYIAKYVLSAHGLLNRANDGILKPYPTTDPVNGTTNPDVKSYENIKDKLDQFTQLDDAAELQFHDMITFLIQEALFCLRELVKMIKLYDPGYVIGYSYIAESHSRMGDWCYAYHNYLHIIQHQIDNEQIGQDVKENYRRRLKKFHAEITQMLGNDGLVYLESRTHYESAIQYYYNIIQIHSEGKAYRDQLHNVYMLEDDYNDNAAHFTIANERLRVNTGNVRYKINQLQKKIEDSMLYQYSSYLFTDHENNDILDQTCVDIYADFFNEKYSNDTEATANEASTGESSLPEE